MKAFILNTENGNIADVSSEKAKVLYFGLSVFEDSIVRGGCCFICGESPNEKEFNNEHIIPDWLLKKFDLHSENIILPNKTKILYGNYKVPCCKECNTVLGKVIEEPMSILIKQAPDSVRYRHCYYCIELMETIIV